MHISKLSQFLGMDSLKKYVRFIAHSLDIQEGSTNIFNPVVPIIYNYFAFFHHSKLFDILLINKWMLIFG